MILWNIEKAYISQLIFGDWIHRIFMLPSPFHLSDPPHTSSIQQPIRILTFPFLSRARDWIERSDLTNVLGDTTGGPRVLRWTGAKVEILSLYRIVVTLAAQIQAPMHSSRHAYTCVFVARICICMKLWGKKFCFSRASWYTEADVERDES